MRIRWDDPKLTIADIFEWAREDQEWVESQSLNKGETEGHGFRGNRYTGGISGEGPAQALRADRNDPSLQVVTAPDPRFLSSNTSPFVGANIVSTNVPIPGGGGATMLSQSIGGVTFIFDKKKLFVVNMPDGTQYIYHDDNSFTVYDKLAPNGVTFENNGIAPAAGPKPFPFDIGFDPKF